jgi:hypothetical protein
LPARRAGRACESKRERIRSLTFCLLYGPSPPRSQLKKTSGPMVAPKMSLFSA